MTTNYDLTNKDLKNSFQLLDYNQEGEIDIPAVLDNLTKLGYDKSHPELYDLIENLGENKINYTDYVNVLNTIMSQKEEDFGLQRMYDLLISNPKVQELDYNSLKRISEEIGNPLSYAEINFALQNAGNGKTITIDSFIEFMKSK